MIDYNPVEHFNKIVREPFYNIIFSTYNSALVTLGKIPNPATNKFELNLVLAQSSIDFLKMLSENTSGQISDEEEQVLNAMISELTLVMSKVDSRH